MPSHLFPSEPRAADGWASAPIDGALADEIRRIVSRLDPSQQLWLSGYLAGLADRSPASEPVVSVAGRPVTVLFGSQSGNSEGLAGRIGEALSARGLPFTLLDMMDCKKTHLQEAETVLIVVSTHGEGDPPDRALPLHELLHSRKAPSLGHLKYSVLALGDSSYEKFCETGRQFDARFAALGATVLHPRIECDVDFDASASRWIAEVAGKLAEAAGPAPGARLASVPRPVASLSNAYTRKNPFLAPVLLNQRITARHSTKDVRHVELSLEGSNIRYEPGDALGIVPRNHPDDVDALLAVLNFDPAASLALDSETVSLREALVHRFDIGPVNRGFVERYAAATGSAALTALLEESAAADLNGFLRGRHIVDLVEAHAPTGLDPAGFAKLLRPLAPRLYSIASSQRSTPDEVHLTISLVQYETFGRRRRGVVSGYVAELDGEDISAPVYLHRNPNFRLPTDANVPVIMIGPGTGVAPFRSFMAEREAAGATGRNWLFFGDRAFDSDFLYQVDWLAWRASGLLTHIDVAFSRDQEEKIYVQHRMRERGEEIWAWLRDGAHIYVCGDAEFMAPDVQAALLDIVERHGGYAAEEAAEYLVQLQRERRYQRDVY